MRDNNAKYDNNDCDGLRAGHLAARSRANLSACRRRVKSRVPVPHAGRADTTPSGVTDVFTIGFPRSRATRETYVYAHIQIINGTYCTETRRARARR